MNNEEQLEGEGAAAQAEAEYQQWMSEQTLHVLYFSAPWCGPCKMFGPAFDEIVAEFDNIDVHKINIDETPEAARTYEVVSIPTIIMEKSGIQVFRHKGVMPKTHLRDIIKANL